MAVFAVVSLLKDDFEPSAGRQLDSLAQPAGAAQAVEHARNRSRILPQLGGFALEAIDFFNHLDRQQDIILLKAEQRIGIVQQHVGIKNIVLFHANSSQCG